MDLDNQEEEEIPMNSSQNNTLNQNFNEELSKEKPNEENPQTKDKKSIKFDVNSISVIPIQESYNLRYGEKLNGYKELDYQTKNIINDPKYADEKRSKSAFSKKSFREKYESLKIKEPTNREWNRDPTSELIIRNLEQKIDILIYENFLLSKKLREIENSNKELKLNMSMNLMALKAEQEMSNELNIKGEINSKNIDNNKKLKKNKKDKKDKAENDVDIYEEINKLKEENNRLRLSNQNLAENNAELNKVIDALKNDINLNKEKEEQNQNEEKNNIMNDNQIDTNTNQNNINLDNINNDNNILNNINDGNDAKIADEQNNSEIDINKYLLNEEQYHQLIEENELLHKKLRNLLLIDGDSKLNFNKNSVSFSSMNKKNSNNIKILDNSINENQNEELAKENYLLKQKIKSLNSELNKMAVENNRKILIIQDRLDEYESKQKQYLNKLEKEKEKNRNNNNEDIDEILNETILAMNRNQDDEESKKMIETIKNIKNEQKKRISQCLIINNKLKSLLQENAELHNQLTLSKKENEISNNTNSNLNNTNTSNFNNNASPHICFCGGGNYSVNALKLKDEMIIKYKDKIDENNEILKLTQNSNNSSNNKNNRIIYEERDYNISNRLKKEKNEGFEDYLLGKIVNNQKEVLGERAPRFYDNSKLNNNKYMSRSMQNDENNKISNRYNNYHYRGRILEDEE